ncbi:MAG: TRAP transporter small permease [Hyphomicrobiaceae bacterium]|nr:TRAP transporter small permease [Hyphomicrobiaceae bacterium]
MTDPLLDALKAAPPPPPPAAPVPKGLWKRFTYYYAQALEVMLALCVGILIIPVTLQIISRYTSLLPNFIWTEEMARFLFVWTIMIGAMVGVRESAHFDVDLWPVLSRRSEAMVRILARLGILALALVFLWAGIEFTKFAWNRTSELGDLPLWLIHIAWPIAGVTWIVFAGEQIVDELGVILGWTKTEDKGV